MKNKELNQKVFRVFVVLLYISITFLLTWTITNRGLSNSLPPVGMLIPAMVAIIIEYMFPRDSKVVNHEVNRKSQWIGYSFILMTTFQILLLISYSVFEISIGVVQSIGNILFIIWTLIIIQLFKSNSKIPYHDRFSLGNTRVGFVFIIAVTLFLLGQSGLNLIFGFGEFQGIKSSIYGIQIPIQIYPLALVFFFLLAVVGGPLGSLATTFGEEYGWRGFLQRELYCFGPRLGGLIVGIVWGLWHLPIIESGIHTYPPTILGYSLAFIFFILWGYIQSYAVLKTQSIWVAAFIHGVVNNLYSFSLNYLVRPYNMLFSFGLGLFGLICLAVIVIYVLRDPIWNSSKDWN